LASSIRSEGESVLIVVDQFEELFRFGDAADAKSSDEAAGFVKLLIEAARQTDGPIYVVLTMRSDFIGDCARFRDLPETVTQGLYLVPRLTRAQRREVIEGPVRVAGGAVTPRLVMRVLNDLGDDPDQLPILQHAMMRAWNHWLQRQDRDRPLDTEDYEAIGGAADALSQHADELYDSLDAEGKRIAHRMFQTLTEKDADNREARRPTRLGSIAAAAAASLDDVRRVVETFRAAGHSFLTPPPPTPLEADTTIDISHESLIRGWRRLRGWVQEEAESARVYRRLAETAALAAEGKAGLWRDPDLAVALDWRERERPSAAWASRYHAGWDVAMRFLDESLAARDAEERARAAARRAEIRRSRLVLAASVVGALVFAALAAVGYREAQSADEQRRAAEQATATANDQKGKVEAALKQAKAERERADDQRHVAEMTARDLIADADHAREQQLELANYLKYVADLAKDTSARESAGWIDEAYTRTSVTLGEFDTARRNLEMQSRSGWSPETTASVSAYVAVMQGDADRAVRLLREYVAHDKNPIYLLDLGDALTMRGDYEEALKAIDEAIGAQNSTVEAVNENIAPDIEAATHYRALYAYGDDVVVTSMYFRSFIFTLEDRDAFDDFQASLAAADAFYSRSGIGANPTDAVNPFLIAIDHGWLAARGQAINLPQASSGPHPTNYGVFAAQGAVWERAAAAQSRYWFAARQAYLAFQAAFGDRPQDRYRRLAAWVRERLAQPQIRDAVDQYVAPDPSALSVEADEIRYHAAGNSYFEVKPALDRLTQAIALLNARSEAGSLEPQERFQLANLYLKRGLWKAEAQDWVGARDDADRAIALNDALADAYVLRARAGIDQDRSVADLERALSLSPSNEGAMSWLAWFLKGSNPDRAIEALELKRRYGTLWADDYLALADLRLGQKNFDAAQTAIAEAIDEAPERSDLCEKQRDIDRAAGLAEPAAQARAAQCLLQGAETAARLGRAAVAVKLYLQALSAAEAPATRSGDGAFAEQNAARSLSAFLKRQFGAADAAGFWNALAKAPSALQVPAERESARIGGE
jgi:hypothetical protein